MNLKYAKCNYIIAFLHTFEKYCYNQDFIDRKFDKDIWDLNDYRIAFERNASLRFRHLYFQKIINPTNKYYVKKYVDYCLCNTDNTINTICGRLACLKFMFNNSEIPYDKWTNNDAEAFINKLTNNYPNKRTLASRMITYYHFTDFLLLHDFISTNPLKKFHSLCAVGTFKHSTIAVDDETISQIFRILGKIQDKSIVLIFLLIYCVGMRVSEACTIASDCLEKTSEGKFINYY